MTAALAALLDDARALADPDAYVLRGRSWHMDGGRPCPATPEGDDVHCSQPVFVDRVTGATDYGQRGGPGHTWCRDNCRHGFREAMQ